MLDLNMLLLASCSLAGLIMVVGSLYLLWKGRIGLDKETRSATKLRLPGGFEVETPVAGLIMFVLGVFMLFIPIHYSPKLCTDLALHQKKPLEMVELRGNVSTDTNIQVYAVVDEQQANADQTIALSVPYLADRRYFVKYFNAAHEMVDEENFRLGGDEKVYKLRGLKVDKGVAPAASPTPKIMLDQTESSSVVSGFTTR